LNPAERANLQRYLELLDTEIERKEKRVSEMTPEDRSRGEFLLKIGELERERDMIRMKLQTGSTFSKS
jgi:hypothetical protein